MKLLKKIEIIIANLEEYLLVTSLITMVLLGATQVILRNFFNTGINWGEQLVRALVLWVGFLGASLATRRNKHINIDIMSKFIKNEKIKKIKNFFINIISIVIVGILFKVSIDFLIVEIESNIKTFLNIPTWIIFLIVPISFFIIALRILINILTSSVIELEDLEKEIK